MTYTPTEKELEELGFVPRSPFWFYWNEFINLDTLVTHDMRKNQWFFDGDVELYPQSLDDIKTLIRILTTQ